MLGIVRHRDCVLLVFFQSLVYVAYPRKSLSSSTFLLLVEVSEEIRFVIFQGIYSKTTTISGNCESFTILLLTNISVITSSHEHIVLESSS